MPAWKEQTKKSDGDGEMLGSKPAAVAAVAPSTPQRHHHHQQPPLFAPYRALGVVTSATAAPAHQRRGDTSFVTTSAGRSWQVYECGRLTLRAIGPLVSAIWMLFLLFCEY